MRRASALIGAVTVFAAALIGAVALPFAAPRAANHAGDIRDLTFAPHPGAQLPLNAQVVDEDGRRVALGGYFGKSPVILVLEYLRCKSLCSVTLGNLIGGDLNRLPLRPGRDYQLLALSIDPRDKPSDAATARADYAHLLDRGGASGLHFLTSSESVARQVADAEGFPYRYDAFLDVYIHPAGFVIASANGAISRYLEGIAITPQELVGALADAEQDKSPGLLARIVLLCHVQGAPLGRFTVPVMAALMLANLAAGLTLIVLFANIRRQG